MFQSAYVFLNRNLTRNNECRKMILNKINLQILLHNNISKISTFGALVRCTTY